MSESILYGDEPMKVIGDKYKMLKKRNPDIIWYMVEKQMTKCEFDEWREIFIKDYKINTAEVVFNGVLDSRPIKITLQQMLDLGSKHPHFGEAIRVIAMKSAYCGTDPKEEYIKLIEQNALNGTRWLLEYI